MKLKYFILIALICFLVGIALYQRTGAQITQTKDYMILPSMTDAVPTQAHLTFNYKDINFFMGLKLPFQFKPITKRFTPGKEKKYIIIPFIGVNGIIEKFECTDTSTNKKFIYRLVD